MIDTKNLSYTYPHSDAPVLRGLSLRIPEGALVCLLGNNGSGKTTLLHVMAGLLQAQGKLRILGHDLPQDADKARRGLALLPQEPDLHILGSTVAEDLNLSLPQNDSTAKSRAAALADRFGLSALLDRPAHALSHGEKRKLCLASALAAAPRLLLMDEPFAGLDFPAMLELRRILADNRAQGITQVVSLHDLELLGDLADFCLVLRRGELSLQGRPVDVYPALADFGLKAPCWWLYGRDGPPYADFKQSLPNKRQGPHKPSQTRANKGSEGR